MIVHSAAARDDVVADLGLAGPDRLHVVPHGHWLDVFPNQVSRAEARQALGFGDSEFVFLFMGAVRPYKGVVELIEQFGRIEGADLRLVVAGGVREPEYESALRAAARKDRRVELRMQRVPAEEVQVLFNACDVAVLPYLDVLTSGASVLAMSFGKPCVAPRTGHLIDVFAPAGVFHYDRSDPAGLRRALRSAFEARPELEARGAANLERARQWDWDTIGLATRRVYEAALASPR